MLKCPRCGQSVEDELKEIEGLTLCRQCWKEYREEKGLVEEGCIFEDMGGCLDREPVYIPPVEVTPPDAYDYGFCHPTRLAIMAKARCYLGHDNCRRQQQEMKNMIQLAKEAYDNRVTLCPHPDCGRTLEMARNEEKSVLRATCPVHGEIWHRHEH